MQQFIAQHQWIIWLLLAWSLPWKGVALWKSAKNSQRVWFIVIFLFNTLAILDIIYIFAFSKKKEEENGLQNGPTIIRNGKRIV